MVEFPSWVKVSQCKTRSMSIVMPRGQAQWRHGAQKWIQTYSVGSPVQYFPAIRVY